MKQLTQSNALRPLDDTGPFTYEDDFLVWIVHQAELLRANKFDQLDITNLIEELTAIAGSQRRELQSRLDILIAHLLKCRYQPSHKSGSWLGTLRVQRSEIGRLIEQSPSLDQYIVPYAAKVYSTSLGLAADETGLPASQFPADNPFQRNELLDPDFVP